MRAGTAKTRSAEELVQRAVRGELDAAALSALCEDSPELISLALLSAAKRIAEEDVRLARLEGGGSAPPSGMALVHTKPNTQKKRRHKKPGAREGRQGVRRERPVRIDERETHRLKSCPHCQGQLQRCDRSRMRVIEDFPDEIDPVVTEPTIHRNDCPHCKKHVEPRFDPNDIALLVGRSTLSARRRRLQSGTPLSEFAR